MNTIKFAPYNDFITEQHNIETAQVKEHVISGNSYKFYSPCNFNIFVTNACPNSCYFCINKNASEICSDEDYFNGLKKSLDTLKDVDIEFTITGGEPTLNPARFVKTLQLLKEYGIKERTISTTGLNLLTLYEGKPLIQYLVENGFIHNISISRMSFNETKNNEIFGAKNISNEDLSKLAYFAKMNEAELRVSTNLMDSSIRDFRDIINFVDENYSIGIDTVLFRQLVGVDNPIEVSPFFAMIRANKNFIYDTTLNGQFYDVDVYIYTSEKTGQKYIVKCYKDKPGDKSVINSLSYNSGNLRIGFNGKSLC